MKKQDEYKEAFNIKRIESDVLFTKGKGDVEDRDSLAACLKKVLDVKFLVAVPDWVLAYPIPADTQASNLPPAAAWMRANLLKKEMRIGMHPCNTIDNILTTSEIKMQGDTLSYVDEKREVKVIKNVRGYFMQEETNTAPIIAAAYNADLIPYFARCDGNGSVESSIKPAVAKSLRLFRVPTTDLRLLFTAKVKSESVARDAIYKYYEQNPDQAFLTCNQLCELHPDYAGRTEIGLKFYNEARKADPKLPELKAILLPTVGKLERMVMEMDLDSMYRYCVDCHKLRGQDGGLGILTFGYLFGGCTRSTVKNITMFLDIRQLCITYNINVVAIVGKLPDLVKRMCVSNEIFLIDSNSVNAGVLTKRAMRAREYSVYASYKGAIRYGIYYTANSIPPKVTEKIVEYSAININSLFQMHAYSLNTRVVFQAVHCHLHPMMGRKEFKYGILPSALPHNAQVMVVTPILKDIKLADMIARTVDANHHRNNWLIVRRSFCILDKYSGQVGYMTPYKIPKMLTREKKKMIDWSGYFSEVREDRDLLDAAEITLDAKIMRPPAPDDITGNYSFLLDVILESGEIKNTTIALFKTWNNEETENAYLRALRMSGKTRDEVVGKIGSMTQKHCAEIDIAYAKLKSLEEENAKKPKPKEEKPQDEDDGPEMSVVTTPKGIEGFAVVEDDDIGFDDFD